MTDRLAVVAMLVAFGTFIGFALAGVSSDRIAIPLHKKIVLTLASFAATVALQMSAIGRRRGCATMVTVYAMVIGLELLVMWSWN